MRCIRKLALLEPILLTGLISGPIATIQATAMSHASHGAVIRFAQDSNETQASDGDYQNGYTAGYGEGVRMARAVGCGDEQNESEPTFDVTSTYGQGRLAGVNAGWQSVCGRITPP
jgi:hypothetical protein